MEIEIEISQWGNSLGIRIPKAFAESLGLKKNSRAKLELENGKLVLEPKKKASYQALKEFEDLVGDLSLEELCKNMTPYGKNNDGLDVEPLENELWEYEE